jgi:hypothetical protein
MFLLSPLGALRIRAAIHRVDDFGSCSPQAFEPAEGPRYARSFETKE